MRSITAFACLLLFSMTCHAQWSWDPKVGTLVSSTSDAKIIPFLHSDSAGGAVITWSTSGTNPGLEGQKLDSLGVGHWGNSGRMLLRGLTYPAFGVQASVRSDADSTVFLAGRHPLPYDYQSMPPGPSVQVIRKIRADGTSVWPDTGVVVSGISYMGSNIDATLCPDHRGGVFYAYRWNDTVRVGRVRADGSLQWGGVGVPVDDGSHYSVYTVALVPDTAEGVYLFFSKWTSAFGVRGMGVYGQHLDSTGSLLWNPLTAMQTPILDVNARNALLAMPDGRGGSMLVISGYDPVSTDSTFRQDVYAQRIGSARQLFWGAKGKVMVRDTADQIATALVTDDASGAWIVFSGKSTAFGRSDQDVLVQHIDSSGQTRLPARGVTGCGNSADIRNPSASADGAGGVLITWEDTRSLAANGMDVYAQRVDAQGRTLWNGTDGVAVSTAPNDQIIPSITTDAAGGAFVCWEDKRAGTNSSAIYAARIRSTGVLLPVDLLAFDAARSGVDVNITWSVARESHLAGYTIERSADAQVWYACGFVPARNSGSELGYSYRDTPPSSGTATWRYRLRMQNLDGTETLSHMVEVAWNTTSAAEMTINVYPMPLTASSEGTIRISGLGEGGGDMHVYDLFGREVTGLRKPFGGPSDANISFAIDALAPGGYMVTASSGARQVSRIMMVVP